MQCLRQCGLKPCSSSKDVRSVVTGLVPGGFGGRPEIKPLLKKKREGRPRKPLVLEGCHPNLPDFAEVRSFFGGKSIVFFYY